METNLLNELVRNAPNLSLNVPRSYKKALEENSGKPMVIRQAKGLKNTLNNLPIIIRPDELIVGTFDEKIPVAIPRPEGSGLRIMREIENLPNRKVNPINVNLQDVNIFKEDLVPFYEKNCIQTFADEIAPESVFDVLFRGLAYVSTEAGGIAHAVIDYKQLLENGLDYYLDHSKKYIEKYSKMISSQPELHEKIAFYKSMKIIIKSILNYAKKYSDKALELSNQESDPKRRQELLEIATNCMNVPKKPPKNINEAIQFIWFIHLALHLENFEHGISFGRLDQILIHYYDGDKDKAIKLFKNLFLKTNEIVALYDSIATQYFGGMATTQGVVIGGVDLNGNDATNELTYTILEAHKLARVPSPNLVVRFHENAPDKLYQTITKIIAEGINIIGLYNDTTATKALERDGIPTNDARNYGIVGCVGLSTSGLSYDNTGAIFLNLPKALELALGTENTTLKDYIPLTNSEDHISIDEVLVCFEAKLKMIIDMAVTAANAFQKAHSELKPTPLMTLCIRDCFNRAVDINKTSAKYNFSGIHLTGFSDVIDSLAAIEHAVFREGKISMKGLATALKNNFRGYKDLRAYLLNKCPKYGSNDEQIDSYAAKLTEIIQRAIKGFICARGGSYRVGIHAMTTNVGFGIFTGALPSGRKRGTPLIKDVAPGSSKGDGLTATINSATSFDHSIFSNGLACTLNIDPEIAKIENGNVFIALLKTYFQRGGLHIQFNAITPKTLIDAQKNPGSYRDLMVRVSGYSARFNDLPKSVQDDIISRYCYDTIKCG